MALSTAEKLSGVPPQILAAICKYTSNYGLTGLGVNATGFGGYFGQHVDWAYPGRPQGFTRTELLTPLMFWAEAQVAAATLAGYRLPLGESLSMYARGTTEGWESTPFVTFVQQTTGADPAGPLSPPPTPTEETDMLTALAVNGQLHIWLTTPQAKTIRHWWQASEGPTAGKWKGPETLPGS